MYISKDCPFQVLWTGLSTFWALESCRTRSNDLFHAMFLAPPQAVCEVDEDSCTCHAVHQLDVIKSRLWIIVCAPTQFKSVMVSANSHMHTVLGHGSLPNRSAKRYAEQVLQLQENMVSLSSHS